MTDHITPALLVALDLESGQGPTAATREWLKTHEAPDYEKEVSAFRLRVEGVPEVQRTKASPSMRNRIHARQKTWRKYAGNPYKQAAFLREWIRIGFQQEELSQITKLDKAQLAKFLKEYA